MSVIRTSTLATLVFATPIGAAAEDWMTSLSAGNLSGSAAPTVQLVECPAPMSAYDLNFQGAVELTGIVVDPDFSQPVESVNNVVVRRAGQTESEEDSALSSHFQPSVIRNTPSELEADLQLVGELMLCAYDGFVQIRESAIQVSGGLGLFETEFQTSFRDVGEENYTAVFSDRRLFYQTSDTSMGYFVIEVRIKDVSFSQLDGEGSLLKPLTLTFAVSLPSLENEHDY